MVLRQLVVVDTIDDGEIGTVCGSGDDDALGASFKMKCCLVARGENAGAFKGDIDVFFLPRQFGRVADGMNLDRAVANIDRIACNFTSLGKRP